MDAGLSGGDRLRGSAFLPRRRRARAACVAASAPPALLSATLYLDGVRNNDKFWNNNINICNNNFENLHAPNMRLFG